ncbi:MAG TPA: LOG family protein, partial [bacterium]|nr:LOG family protein [bacterium]
MPKSRLPHLDETGVPLKAYDNGSFLHSPDGRTLRVISEMHEPYARFKKYGIRDTIVFYGSARILDPKDAKRKLLVLQKEANNQLKPSVSLRRQIERVQSDLEMSAYYRDAMKLAEMLTRWSSKLDGGKRFIVCSGGGPGIMEAANRGAKKAGGPTIGLNISLPFEQIPNPYISPELNFEFHYFFMRKFWFAYLAKALVVFPGGYG